LACNSVDDVVHSRTNDFVYR